MNTLTEFCGKGVQIERAASGRGSFEFRGQVFHLMGDATLTKDNTSETAYYTQPLTAEVKGELIQAGGVKFDATWNEEDQAHHCDWSSMRIYLTDEAEAAIQDEDAVFNEILTHCAEALKPYADLSPSRTGMTNVSYIEDVNGKHLVTLEFDDSISSIQQSALIALMAATLTAHTMMAPREGKTWTEQIDEIAEELQAELEGAVSHE